LESESRSPIKSFWVEALHAIKMDHLFITDVLAQIGSRFGEPGPWGKVVVQIPSRDGAAERELIAAEAKLVAIHAATRKWPGIIRLQDAGKLVLEDCDWDVNALGRPFYADSLGTAWIIDPDREIPKSR
jgi:hypothetical protein